MTASLAALLALVVVVKLDAGGDKDFKALQGTWLLVSAEQNGKEMPADMLKTAKLIIKGNKHFVSIGGEKCDGTHTLDATTKPKSIDSIDGDRKMLGIYELTKGTFKVCFAEPGKDRPKEFTGKEGSGCFVHVWKRAKSTKK